MILFYIFFGWFILVTIGFELIELRPDKDRIYTQLLILKRTTKFAISFPLVMFFYLPFSIYYSLKKILGKND
jgi:hypothetical protein